MSLAISGAGHPTCLVAPLRFVMKPDILVLMVATNDMRDNYAALVARSYNANPLWRANHYFEMAEATTIDAIPPSGWYTSLAPDVYTVHVGDYTRGLLVGYGSIRAWLI